MEDSKLKKIIETKTTELMKDYLKSSAFTDRKLTDTPTDALSTVNRKYVTLNGLSASRPRSSVIGQSYFDTSLGKPIWWNGTSFVDATGTTV